MGGTSPQRLTRLVGNVTLETWGWGIIVVKPSLLDNIGSLNNAGAFVMSDPV